MITNPKENLSILKDKDGFRLFKNIYGVVVVVVEFIVIVINGKLLIE